MSCYPSRSLLKQIWTSSGVMVSNAGQGMVIGCMAVIMEELRKSTSDIHAESDDVSSIGSTFNMAVLLGFLLSSILMEVFGRKLGYLALIIPGPVGLILIYTATSIPLILVGIMLAAVTSGSTSLLGAVVLGEYTGPEHRGMFLILNTAVISFGSMISRILANYYQWRTLAILILIPYIMSFLIACTWSESPAWLVLKGKNEVGECGFFSLRGVNYKTKTEFREMTRNQTESLLRMRRSPYIEIPRKFIKRSFIRPMFITFMGCVLMEISGKNIVRTYASQIISEVQGSVTYSSYDLYVDFLMAASAMFSAFLIKFMRTRTLLFSSGAASLIVLLIANTYVFLTSNNIISNSLPWLPKTTFGLYFILVNLGCIPIPMALLGEIFPLIHKGFGLLVTGILSNFCFNATIKAFPSLFASLKIYGTFAITGMIQTLVLMILFIVLPETKYKTLQEIEDSIQYGRVEDTKSLCDYDEKDRMLNVNVGS